MRSIIYSCRVLTALLLTPQIIDAHYDSSESLTLAQDSLGAHNSSTLTESVSTTPSTDPTQTTSQTQTTETAEEVVPSNNLSELKLVASEIRDNLKAVFTTTAEIATGVIDVISATVPVIASAATLVITVGTLAWLTLKTLYIIHSITAEGVDNMYTYFSK